MNPRQNRPHAFHASRATFSRRACSPFPRAIHKKFLLILNFALAATLTGCATPDPIPHYPTLSTQDSLQILQSRYNNIHTLTAQGLLTLTDPHNNNIRLDIALALQPPHNARLRAWKFSQAVFDLTVTPKGVWIIQPPTSNEHPTTPFDAKSAATTRQWLALLATNPMSPDATIQLQSNKLLIHRPLPHNQTLTTTLDRQTLTPRQYTITTAQGQTPFTLMLDHYALFNNIPWPQHITATSPTGKLQLDLHDIQINPGLPAGAFHPPRRATKILGAENSAAGLRPNP